MAGVAAALLIIALLLAWLMMADLVPGPLVLGKYRADKRADVLTRRLLSPIDYGQLEQLGYIEVGSRIRSKRVYRIGMRCPMVQVVDNDIVVANLCLQPLERLPRKELVLAHKLMLETDERDYWSRANIFPPLATA